MRRRRVKPALLLPLVLGASLLSGCGTPAAAGDPADCPAGQVSRGGVCLAGDAAAFARAQVQGSLAKYKLTASMAEVWTGGERVASVAAGQSMTGIPATPDMRFRNGAVVIPYLTSALLKLVDEGRVSLDDSISRWRPDLPHADAITLRMLASTTSGYADYVRDPKFLAALYENPFRHWTSQELVRISVDKPLVRAPGSGFAYSHANWQILGDIIGKVRGRPLAEVMREEIIGPLGLTGTSNPSTAEIPAPVLHAFDNERKVFEDSTYWDPSWTIAPGAVMTSTMADMAKSFAAIGEGRLLSPESHKAQLTPVATVQPGVSYALGLVVDGDWILQNPSFAGYAATVAYLPAKKLAIATVATQGKGSTVQNASTEVLIALAAHLAPDHPLKLR
ncbi:CubicO group peptidase (beta-lactamase class C family) [Streptomyces sp. Ag109_G2-6]|uniref:serine hydrolase domain-containing protein n=1 Tax=Streptomyces TaxID=1883 RepID=UPI000F50AEF9|nr:MULTISPECIES: serine hydrolase domain-containing protein [Streptomyces]RPF45993.1 CubicO group peptidase (beta-lactamase class C family) [Streptomyces sp. Ag109_G2-6]